jgi:hypothetical protein
VRACVRACVCACVRACVHACVRVCEIFKDIHNKVGQRKKNIAISLVEQERFV